MDGHQPGLKDCLIRKDYRLRSELMKSEGNSSLSGVHISECCLEKPPVALITPQTQVVSLEQVKGKDCDISFTINQLDGNDSFDSKSSTKELYQLEFRLCIYQTESKYQEKM